MERLGFLPYVQDNTVRGCIITTFPFPKNDANFVFDLFYTKLADKGYVIYPGKLANLECFRIGSIGQLYESDMLNLVNVVEEVLQEMDVCLPVEC